MRTLQQAFCTILILLISGCATWNEHGVGQAGCSKVSVVILPVQSAVQIKHLSDIRTASESDVTNESEQVAAQMRENEETIGRFIVTNLYAGGYFRIIPPEQVEPVWAAMNANLTSSPLTTSRITEIGGQFNAETVLTIQIAGYGKIKKKWLFYLIGSGIVEGTVEGTLAASASGSTWAGVAVAAEEILQEILTWGGGAFLFNRIYTPVILEAELISTADGKTIWSDTAFARVNRQALKKLPEAERKKKEIRLKLTAEKAAQELVENLNKKASRNIKTPDASGSGNPDGH